MEDKIKKRIEELKKELDESAKRFQGYIQAVEQLKQEIIAKQGAIKELEELNKDTGKK